jgi:hypothetical protein
MAMNIFAAHLNMRTTKAGALIDAPAFVALQCLYNSKQLKGELT